jgi:hypothetical protein
MAVRPSFSEGGRPALRRLVAVQIRRGVFDVSAMGIAGGPVDESTQATRGATARNKDVLGPCDIDASECAGAPTPESAGTTA